jgi:transcription initiation factor TFIID subunit 8
MSNGGRESEREPEKPAAQRKPSGVEFAQAIAKIAVAQICESEGFQTFQQSAIETLSDVAVRYIRDVGKTAHYYANLAGRTECNVFDIIQGLEDLGSAQGFLGASEIEHCLASSGTVRELAQYVGEADQIPFSYSLPQFPVVKDRKLTPSFLQIGEEPPGEHIPTWLPAYPDPSTYAQSSTRNERSAEPPPANIEQENQHRKEERSSLNFHQQLGRNGLEGHSLLIPGDASKAKKATESNPFLAAPLQFGEKEVSPVVLPAKAKLSNEATMGNPMMENHGMDNHISVLEAFAPDIEAMKSRLCDTEEGPKKVLLNSRPTVQFKIGIGKKSFGTMLDLSPENESFEVAAPWFGRENEKDDKKRRAQKIMKESMRNTKELDHL